MATLKEQRRAIADGMARSRAPTGQAERNATGRSMIERRTGKAVVEDINRLTGPRSQRKTLTPVAPVGALPPTRGRGVYTAPVNGTGGGIASPLGEQPGTREFFDERIVRSTDGLLAMRIRNVKTVRMRDANDEEVVMEFENVPWS